MYFWSLACRAVDRKRVDEWRHEQHRDASFFADADGADC
jgi:hypothetical protein